MNSIQEQFIRPLFTPIKINWFRLNLIEFNLFNLECLIEFENNHPLGSGQL